MSEKIFHYIHHAAFWLEAEGKRALFDPFLEGNPEHLRAQDIDADWILSRMRTPIISEVPLKSRKEPERRLFPRQKSAALPVKPGAHHMPCTSAGHTNLRSEKCGLRRRFTEAALPEVTPAALS